MEFLGLLLDISEQFSKRQREKERERERDGKMQRHAVGWNKCRNQQAKIRTFKLDVCRLSDYYLLGFWFVFPSETSTTEVNV